MAIKLKNKIIFVTGGTGSFGRHVTELFLNADVREVRVFSRDEKKQSEMESQFNDGRLKFFLGDIRDEASISRCINNVDYVFHAAALKQVPKCEIHPIEAFKTNVLGTENLLRQAENASVEKVVCLSTDKACHPINAMGMSKAMMEKIALSATADANDDAGTAVNVVRYGNIMCSRGSVIPLFIRQAKIGENLTITAPNMTRFLMSLDESTDLVMRALADGANGDTFVRRSESCTVMDLADAIRQIFPSKSKVDYIGMRLGEKMHETLVTHEERDRAEETENYFRFNKENAGSTTPNKENSRCTQSFSSENAHRLTVDQIVDKLLSVKYVQRELDV